MKTIKTVLISPAGGQAIYGIIQYFRKRGMTVIGIDGDPESVGRFFVDRFYNVPLVEHPAYAGRIADIIEQCKADIFISWLDPEIIFWNRKFYGGEIPEHIKDVFSFNFRADIADYYDKYAFYSLLEKKGFLCPKTLLLSDRENFSRMERPAIIKPVTGYGSKNTYVADNRLDVEYIAGSLLRKESDLTRYMIQEFITGTEYTIDFFSLDGKMVNAVARKRLEHRGVSLRGEVVVDPAIELYIRDFCSAFQVSGLNNIQIIQAGEGFYIIDFNPRPSGTVVFSINAGVDLMNNLLERAEGRPITRYGSPGKLKMVRYLTEYYYE